MVTTENIISSLNEIVISPAKIKVVAEILLGSDSPDIQKRLAELWTIVLLNHGELIANGFEYVETELEEKDGEIFKHVAVNKRLEKDIAKLESDKKRQDERIEELKEEVEYFHDMLTKKESKLLSVLEEQYREEIEQYKTEIQMYVEYIDEECKMYRK